MLIKIQRSKDTQCPLKKKVFSFLCISAHKDKVFQPINQRMSIKMSKRDILSAPPHPLALNVYSWIIRKKGTSIRNPCME